MGTPARKYTNMLLEKLENNELVDKDQVILACLDAMSEDEVKIMMQRNEWIGESCAVCEDIEELTENGLCEDCEYEQTCKDCGSFVEDVADLDNDGYCPDCQEEEEEIE